MTEKDMELFRDIQEQALQVKLNIRIGQSVCSWVRNRVNYIVGKAVAVYSSVWSDVVCACPLLVKVFFPNPW